MGKKFNRLEKRVENEYEKKGYGKKRAEYIGKATAGKIYREQQEARHRGLTDIRHHNSDHRCVGCSCRHKNMAMPHVCHSCSSLCTKG